MTPSTRGMAIPVLLLLLLALTALAHGALLLSRHELQATRSFLDATRAGEAAEASPRVALGGWGGLPAERRPWVLRPLGSGVAGGGLTVQAGLRWLDGEFFLLEGRGGVLGWEGGMARGWVGWAMDPAVRMGAFRAVAEVGGSVPPFPAGGLNSGGFRSLPVGWPPTACEPFAELLDSLFRRGPPALVGPLGRPTPEELGATSPVPPLGLLTGGILEELHERTGAGGATGGSPATGSATSPAGSGCPGSGDAEFLYEEGTLTLRQGSLCGLLVTGGDLVLAGTARVQGLALVGGDLILGEGALYQGLARIRGDLRIRHHARFDASACAAYRVLVRLPVLGRPFLLPHLGRVSSLGG